MGVLIDASVLIEHERERLDVSARIQGRAHARLGADLASEGRSIGVHDLWLAAACLADGLSLATGNPHEFEQVPGLELEVWSGA